MSIYVCDPAMEGRLRAERKASGFDRYDEVWEGVYVMPPMANNEHQGLASRLGGVFQQLFVWPTGGCAYVGINVSDREEDWKDNYRIPDVAVVLPGTCAKNCNTHFFGGPDFVVEIASFQDRSREKISFYGRIGVRELLLINRDPWELELFQNQDGNLLAQGLSSFSNPITLESSVLSVAFRLVPGNPRPVIEVMHRDGLQRWLV